LKLPSEIYFNKYQFKHQY